MEYVGDGKSKIMVGLILSLIGGLIPYIGSFIVFIGSILVLFGIRIIAKAAEYPRPFYLYLLNVILGLIFGILIILNWDAVQKMSFSAIWFLLWLILIVEGCIQAVVWLDMGKITNVRLFNTGAVILLIGNFLFVIIIGAFILLVARIILIVAASQIPDYIAQYQEWMKSKITVETFTENL